MEQVFCITASQGIAALGHQEPLPENTLPRCFWLASNTLSWTDRKGRCQHHHIQETSRLQER